jgi:hypothetical protein
MIIKSGVEESESSMNKMGENVDLVVMLGI